MRYITNTLLAVAITILPLGVMANTDTDIPPTQTSYFSSLINNIWNTITNSPSKLSNQQTDKQIVKIKTEIEIPKTKINKPKKRIQKKPKRRVNAPKAQIAKVLPSAFSSAVIVETIDDKISQAKDINTDKSILDTLAYETNDDIKWQVASNPNTAPDTLFILSLSSDTNIRLNVAKNKNADPATLSRLATIGDGNVKWQVANNPNTSISTLKKLEKDSDIAIVNMAKNSLKKRRIVNIDNNTTIIKPIDILPKTFTIETTIKPIQILPKTFTKETIEADNTKKIIGSYTIYNPNNTTITINQIDTTNLYSNTGPIASNISSEAGITQRKLADKNISNLEIYTYAEKEVGTYRNYSAGSTAVSNLSIEIPAHADMIIEIVAKINDSSLSNTSSAKLANILGYISYTDANGIIKNAKLDKVDQTKEVKILKVIPTITTKPIQILPKTFSTETIKADNTKKSIGSYTIYNPNNTAITINQIDTTNLYSNTGPIASNISSETGITQRKLADKVLSNLSINTNTPQQPLGTYRNYSAGTTTVSNLSIKIPANTKIQLVVYAKINDSSLSSTSSAKLANILGYISYTDANGIIKNAKLDKVDQTKETKILKVIPTITETTTKPTDDKISQAKDISTDQNTLIKLSGDLDGNVKWQVANNPNTPASTLNDLANDTDVNIRLNVAKNQNTDLATLDKLATDIDGNVKWQVAANPKTDITTLKKLATDNDINIANMAKANLENK